MRRQKEDDNRLNLDKMKSLMNQNLQEDKMEQQEDLAVLRATTSLEKQKMSNRAKMKNDRMKQQDVRILKRPRSQLCQDRVCTHNINAEEKSWYFKTSKAKSTITALKSYASLC